MNYEILNINNYNGKYYLCKYKNNLLVQKGYFSRSNYPVFNKKGYSVVQYFYDNKNRLVKEIYLDIYFAPFKNVDGFAGIMYERDKNKTRKTYLNRYLNPTPNKSNIIAEVYELHGENWTTNYIYYDKTLKKKYKRFDIKNTIGVGNYVAVSLGTLVTEKIYELVSVMHSLDYNIIFNNFLGTGFLFDFIWQSKNKDFVITDYETGQPVYFRNPKLFSFLLNIPLKYYFIKKGVIKKRISGFYMFTTLNCTITLEMVEKSLDKSIYNKILKLNTNFGYTMALGYTFNIKEKTLVDIEYGITFIFGKLDSIYAEYINYSKGTDYFYNAYLGISLKWILY